MLEMRSVITKIGATELARRLSDVLNRVRYRDERFLVERNGEPIATIGPAAPFARITLAELVARLPSTGSGDAGFADDLEAIQASQSPAESSAWPT